MSRECLDLIFSQMNDSGLYVKNRLKKMKGQYIRAAVANCHKLGGLKQQKFYSFTVLEARSPKSMY